MNGARLSQPQQATNLEGVCASETCLYPVCCCRRDSRAPFLGLMAVGRGRALAKSIASDFSDSHNEAVRSIKISVKRSRPNTGQSPQFEQHEIEVAEKASVLDALFALQQTACPDLAFRFSCRVGM